MNQSSKLTEEEKRNGKRKFLIPSQEIQNMMEPTTEEEFASLVKRAIPPSPQPDQATK